MTYYNIINSKTHGCLVCMENVYMDMLLLHIYLDNNPLTYYYMLTYHTTSSSLLLHWTTILLWHYDAISSNVIIKLCYGLSSSASNGHEHWIIFMLNMDLQLCLHAEYGPHLCTIISSCLLWTLIFIPTMSTSADYGSISQTVLMMSLHLITEHWTTTTQLRLPELLQQVITLLLLTNALLFALTFVLTFAMHVCIVSSHCIFPMYVYITCNNMCAHACTHVTTTLYTV